MPGGCSGTSRSPPTTNCESSALPSGVRPCKREIGEGMSSALSHGTSNPVTPTCSMVPLVLPFASSLPSLTYLRCPSPLSSPPLPLPPTLPTHPEHHVRHVQVSHRCQSNERNHRKRNGRTDGCSGSRSRRRQPPQGPRHPRAPSMVHKTQEESQFLTRAWLSQLLISSV